MLPLTDNAALDRLLSVQGVISFTETDDQGADFKVKQECIDYAIAFFLGRLAARYTAAQLNQSVIGREITTVIAARTLAYRRGNPIPDSLEMRFQELVARGGDIDQISSGRIQLIDDNGSVMRPRSTSAPTMSNLRVDRRYANETVRVVNETSTDVQTKLDRDLAPTRYFSG